MDDFVSLTCSSNKYNVIHFPILAYTTNIFSTSKITQQLTYLFENVQGQKTEAIINKMKYALGVNLYKTVIVYNPKYIITFLKK